MESVQRQHPYFLHHIEVYKRCRPFCSGKGLLVPGRCHLRVFLIVSHHPALGQQEPAQAA